MYVDDSNSTKPEDWDDEEMIVDKDATRPEDWDDAKEGEWKSPKTRNPKYKGPWSPKKIYNNNYKGIWKSKMIPNPEYKEVSMESYTIGGLGFDVWQVKAGTIFDNIMIADSLEDAFDHVRLVLEKQVLSEMKAKAESDKEDESKEAEAKRKLDEGMKNAKKGEEREDL